ncbi:hypothetical protein EYC98_00195 [Halieaceae bacterium IMCC14734]|uniref:CopL family metal-binding regulatory protein n=1 Tax=Candidatus Litorirhabdus singularis TaxID=2518993 RepID=A0ABT3TAG2_9GAMM|nr:hypothetical protein [Candidatus Litorirhabdus singularis]MCX2979281.1 hypothetical protein [Candidatus Litorirhabdus singularis]
MIRVLGMSLLILGLVFQSLAYAMPDFAADIDSSSLPTTADTAISSAHHAAMAADQDSTAPCHEPVAELEAPGHCADCEGDCANGACASACSLGAAAILGQPALIPHRTAAAPLVAAIEGSRHAVAARIFHPPKHA